MRSIFFRISFVCALSLSACIPLLHAQKVTGSITGEVTDSSGAAITGARVVAQNLDTGVDTGTSTNSSGVYTIEFLPIGHYQVTIQANGFSTTVLQPFTLEVLQTAKFNVSLKVGSAESTVSVSAASPILETEQPTVDTTFTANTIANLPLNGLDFSALTLYVPGAVEHCGYVRTDQFRAQYLLQLTREHEWKPRAGQ